MRRIVPAAVLLSLVLGISALTQDVTEQTEKILDRIEDNNGATLAADIAELKALGRAAMGDVRKSLKRPSPFVRIAAGCFLYAFEMRDEALEALSKVVAGKDVRGKRAAAEYFAALVGTDQTLSPKDRSRIADDLTAKARELDDDLARVHIWRAVWSLTETIQPKRELRDILRKSQKEEVQHEAALALAEMDSFLGNSRELKELASVPGERGRLARAFLKVKALQDDLNRALLKAAGTETTKRDYEILDELIDKLHEHYYDEEKIDDKKLIEAAARGLCGSLDRYSSYYDEKMIKDLKEEGLGGKYGGIGARVSMQKDKQGNAWLTITEPIFSGPAYKAGLRSNDQIVEVEGESTVNKDLTELVKRLRGEPGTEVTFKVYRRGWLESKPFTIVRAKIQLETTMHRMLPGKIGYILLSTFGGQDIKGVRQAVDDLTEQGMKALIFDLRGNSGGYLRTAEAIADYFLAKGKLIVSTRARGEERERRESERDPITDVPLAVLVNGESASASEILSGALKVHERAVVIGRRTFGKGSVQDLKYLDATEEKTALRVTIAKWYLPDGKSVESDDPKTPGGVEPNIVVELVERDFWKEAEFDRIRAGDEVANYLRSNFQAHKELFQKLAESDGKDHTKYPGFDELYAKLKTKASKEEVRELLRFEIRKAVQDDQGKPLYFDFQADVELQRAIQESCKKAQIDLTGIKEYETFAKAEDK